MNGWKCVTHELQNARGSRQKPSDSPEFNRENEQLPNRQSWAEIDVKKIKNIQGENLL